MPSTNTDPQIFDQRALIEGVETRDIDAEKRQVTFVAATENGVETYVGREYLVMEGADLRRFRKVGTILDTHDRWTVGAVIGKPVQTDVEGSDLVMKVEFAKKTQRSEDAWQLVSTGFVKTMSIGYRYDQKNVEVLREGERWSGNEKMVGPGIVVRQWELLEASVVSVPADEEARRRVYFGRDHQESDLSPMALALARAVERCLAPTTEESSMADETTPKTEEEQRAAPEATPAEAPGTEPSAAQAERERADIIRARTPKGFEDLAERFVAEGVSVETARYAFLAALGGDSQPAGHQEPPTAQRETEVTKQPEITDDMLVRGFLG